MEKAYFGCCRSKAALPWLKDLADPQKKQNKFFKAAKEQAALSNGNHMESKCCRKSLPLWISKKQKKPRVLARDGC